MKIYKRFKSIHYNFGSGRDIFSKNSYTRSVFEYNSKLDITPNRRLIHNTISKIKQSNIISDKKHKYAISK